MGSSAHGTTDAGGKVVAVLLQAVVPPAAAGTDAARSDPGERRRTYSKKGIPTLTVMETGRHVRHWDDNQH